MVFLHNVHRELCILGRQLRCGARVMERNAAGGSSHRCRPITDGASFRALLCWRRGPSPPCCVTGIGPYPASGHISWYGNSRALTDPAWCANPWLTIRQRPAGEGASCMPCGSGFASSSHPSRKAASGASCRSPGNGCGRVHRSCHDGSAPHRSAGRSVRTRSPSIRVW